MQQSRSCQESSCSLSGSLGIQASAKLMATHLQEGTPKLCCQAAPPQSCDQRPPLAKGRSQPWAQLLLTCPRDRSKSQAVHCHNDSLVLWKAPPHLGESLFRMSCRNTVKPRARRRAFSTSACGAKMEAIIPSPASCQLPAAASSCQ